MKIKLTAFMSHDATEIELPAKGLVLVSGPNGAGKSALVEGVSMGVWGKGLRGRWSPWRPGVKGSVHLTHDGLVVDRRWSGREKSVAWSLVGRAEEKYDTNSKAQDALESIVGSHEAWRRTSVFSSSDAAHFTMATDTERKELLEALLGLGWFDRALDGAKSDLRTARAERAGATREIELLTEKVRSLEQSAAELPPAPKDVPNVGDLKLKLARYREMARDVQTEAEMVGGRITKLHRTAAAGDGAFTLLKTRLDHVEVDECAWCHQKIDTTLRATLEVEVKAEAARLAALRREAEQEAAPLHEEIDELAEQRERLNELIAQTNEKLRTYGADATRIAAEAVRRGRVEGELIRDRGRLEATLVKAVALDVDVAELEAVEQVLGIRGVRAHLLGQTLGGIEALANAWLTRLQSQIQVELRSYTEKKTGGVVDAISLNLEGAGGEHGYLGASAGERRRVDVAILLALSELASAATGTSRLAATLPIFMDECFDSLDAAGVEAVTEVLRTLAEDRCVVLITHNDALAKAVRFDLCLRVDSGRVV